MIPRDRHVVVVGLGFGDEAKGATVDHLCATREVSTVVRFNGGSQAAHNVVARGRHHTFRQFGSGTFSGVPSFLSRHMLVDPMLLAQEAEALAGLGVDNPLGLLTIDPDALLVTPVHVAANRTREDRRGGGRHGSTGLGIGETVWYDLVTKRGGSAGEPVENFSCPSTTTPTMAALRVRDCLTPTVLRQRLEDLTTFYAPLLAGSPHRHPSIVQIGTMFEEFARAVRIAAPDHLAGMAEQGPVVFEGAQGVLLDEWRGFHPHTTWSTTTPDNAQALLSEAGLLPGYVLGLTRAYTTRHGAGPFPSEDSTLATLLPEHHNGLGEYQGSWRVGHLDLVALRYALEVVGGVDGVALSHLDVVDAADGAVSTVTGYIVDGRRLGRLPVGRRTDLDHQRILTEIAFRAQPVHAPFGGGGPVGAVEDLGFPVEVTATGPAREDRKDR